MVKPYWELRENDPLLQRWSPAIHSAEKYDYATIADFCDGVWDVTIYLVLREGHEENECPTPRFRVQNDELDEFIEDIISGT